MLFMPNEKFAASCVFSKRFCNNEIPNASRRQLRVNLSSLKKKYIVGRALCEDYICLDVRLFLSSPSMGVIVGGKKINETNIYTYIFVLIFFDETNS